VDQQPAKEGGGTFSLVKKRTAIRRRGKNSDAGGLSCAAAKNRISSGRYCRNRKEILPEGGGIQKGSEDAPRLHFK